MFIETIVVTPFQQNCRILVDPATLRGVVVDPGGDVSLILAEIEKRKIQVERILLTHAHIDHAGGVQALENYLKQRGHAPTLEAHRAEKVMRQRVTDQAVMFGLSPSDYQNVREPDRYLEDGDTVRVGEIQGHVLFTPGHSPGHVAFFFPNLPTGPVLIAGDTLFAGSIGRTDLPGGNHETLLRSLKEKIVPLPGDTRVLSGHGPETTIEEETQTNPFLTGLA